MAQIVIFHGKILLKKNLTNKYGEFTMIKIYHGRCYWAISMSTVPPSTSNAQQNFGPCRTPPKFNEVKISSKTKNNIVYLTFNMKYLIIDTIEWMYEWVYKTMFFRSFEALVKTVKTFCHVCSIISIISSSIIMNFYYDTLKNIS